MFWNEVAAAMDRWGFAEWLAVFAAVGLMIDDFKAEKQRCSKKPWDG